ncbi:phage antirepressor [Bacillus sp. FSL K6-0047]
MNQLQRIFNYEYHQVRTVVIQNVIWFVAKDVCEILNIKKHRDALSRLDEDERGSVVVDTLGGSQTLSSVNEQGLYALIFTSRKPEAKSFKRWVTHEVLPTIRETGSYSVNQPSYMINDPIARAEQWIRERKELEQERLRAAQYEEKADYVDRILQSPGAITITQIAKDYGLSAVRLNQILKDEGVQFKRRDQWLLTARFAGKGYTKSQTTVIKRSDGREDARMHTVWTQKGRLFIHEIMKKHGYAANVEKKLLEA